MGDGDQWPSRAAPPEGEFALGCWVGQGSPLRPGAPGHGATAIHLTLGAWTLALIGGGEARAVSCVNVYTEGKLDVVRQASPGGRGELVCVAARAERPSRWTSSKTGLRSGRTFSQQELSKTKSAGAASDGARVTPVGVLRAGEPTTRASRTDRSPGRRWGWCI